LVLEGGKKLIARHKPLLIFEHGLGGADVYGITPQQMYGLLAEELGYRIFLLEEWLGSKTALSKEGFIQEFEEGRNYYFAAAHLPNA